MIKIKRFEFDLNEKDLIGFALKKFFIWLCFEEIFGLDLLYSRLCWNWYAKILIEDLTKQTLHEEI